MYVVWRTVEEVTMPDGSMRRRVTTMTSTMERSDNTPDLATPDLANDNTNTSTDTTAANQTSNDASDTASNARTSVVSRKRRR